MPQRPNLTVAAARPGEGAWERLRAEAEAARAREPLLARALGGRVLDHESLAAALADLLAAKLESPDLDAGRLRALCAQAYADDPGLIAAAEADLAAVYERDAAARGFLQPFLYFKGFQALQAWRIAHRLWGEGRNALAYHLQSLISERFAVDIHPAARLGKGVMIDHATGVVIGETAEVGDDCSLLHAVTLGGTGVKGGDRHPKIGRGVLIGAGAKVLGDITVGDEARIAAGSVVLKPVAARCTVAGVPARPIGGPCCPEPAKRMDHTLEEEG